MQKSNKNTSLLRSCFVQVPDSTATQGKRPAGYEDILPDLNSLEIIRSALTNLSRGPTTLGNSVLPTEATKLENTVTNQL